MNLFGWISENGKGSLERQFQGDPRFRTNHELRALSGLLSAGKWLDIGICQHDTSNLGSSGSRVGKTERLIGLEAVSALGLSAFKGAWSLS
jgi:hypothetical protein